MNARIVLFLGRSQEAKKTRYLRIGQPGPPPEKKTYLPWRVLVEDAVEACPDSGGQVVVIGSNDTYNDWSLLKKICG